VTIIIIIMNYNYERLIATQTANQHIRSMQWPVVPLKVNTLVQWY